MMNFRLSHSRSNAIRSVPPSTADSYLPQKSLHKGHLRLATLLTVTNLLYLAKMLVIVAVPQLALASDRPNILVCISDDQSYPHASAYGYEAIRTPGFDRVAKMGARFDNAFTPAPGCSPMRASFLTGRYIWQIQHAGTHASSFPQEYTVYQDKLEDAGYWIGYTGKGWSPGNWKASGRQRNPAGPNYSSKRMQSPPGIRNTDYAANFVDFLDQRPAGQPFSFWYGASEPHRGFDKAIGERHGMDPSQVKVPPFLPDTPEIRGDILDQHAGYHDIDPCPTLDVLVEQRDDPAIGPFLNLAVERRPAEQLFDIIKDPGCTRDIASDPKFAEVKQRLSERLIAQLKATGDPRVVGTDGGDVFESYPRYSPLRWFPKPDWADQHPERVPTMEWVEKRRPK